MVILVTGLYTSMALYIRVVVAMVCLDAHIVFTEWLFVLGHIDENSCAHTAL